MNPIDSALAYLGKKLDLVVEAIRNTPQKVQLDIGDISTPVKEFTESTRKLSELLPELQKGNNRELARTVKGFTDELGRTTKALQSTLERSQAPSEQLLTFFRASAREKAIILAEHGEKIDKVPEAVEAQTVELLSAISSLEACVSKLDKEQKEIDFFPVLQSLQKLTEKLNRPESKNTDIIKALKAVEKAISEKEWKEPKYIIGGGGSATQLSSTLDNGANTVGASAEQLTSSTYKCKNGVIVKASSDNTGKVYIGDSSAVTAGTADATDGFELSAGHSITIPVDKPSRIWLIGSAASQKVYWLGQ